MPYCPKAVLLKRALEIPKSSSSSSNHMLNQFLLYSIQPTPIGGHIPTPISDKEINIMEWFTAQVLMVLEALS